VTLEVGQLSALSQLLSYGGSSCESHPPTVFLATVVTQSRIRHSSGEAHELSERHNGSRMSRIKRGTYLGAGVSSENE